MASTSFFVFCTPEEFIGWIRTLCGEKQLGCISFRNTGAFGWGVNSPNELLLYSDTYRMFLYPKSDAPQKPLTMNDIKARDWGWVDVRPGQLREENAYKILTYSEIHGEDFESEPVHPAKYVRWLKRHLKGIINTGVRGKNMKTGGESTYRDIYYTSCAYELYCSGVVWKQFLDGNVIFEPAILSQIWGKTPS